MVSKLLITASEWLLLLICLLMRGCYLMEQWLNFFFFFLIYPHSLLGALSGLPCRLEQWRTREPCFPTGPSESRPGAEY